MTYSAGFECNEKSKKRSMVNYTGVKKIKAVPMNRKEYNDYQGWEVSEDENQEDEGYLVEYLDGGPPNHPDHANYISWSPKDVFERAYRKTEGMTFGLAIEAMKKGKKVARKVWNGKGMFVYIVNGSMVNGELLRGEARANVYQTLTGHTDETRVRICPHIDMKAADGSIVVGWLASQTDMLSEDWEIV